MTGKLERPNDPLPVNGQAHCLSEAISIILKGTSEKRDVNKIFWYE